MAKQPDKWSAPLLSRRALLVGGAASGAVYASQNVAGNTDNGKAVLNRNPSRRAIGIHTTHGPWDGGADLDAYTTEAGVAPRIVMWYQDWAHADAAPFNAANMNVAVAHHATPMVTWEPWDYTGGADQPAYTLASISSGTYDAYLHTWARAAHAWGKPFYLRLAHEMNGNWYPWAVGVNGNTGADYVAMWRHVRAIFLREGARNVRWVWSPNVAYPGSAAFASVYPGDAAVDWIALDGYNWGTSQGDSQQWQTFAEIFAPSYDALTALTTKRLMIAETGCTELGGDKAAWITSAMLTEIPNRLPLIRSLIWFNENKETDWRVESSPAALNAWKQAVASPVWQGR